MQQSIARSGQAAQAGNSYLFAFTRGMLKPLVYCVEALAELLCGEALVPFDIDVKLRKQLTLLDTPGIVGLALAGIDMAV
jgi:mandelate racemase